MTTLQEQNASLQQALQIVKDENEVNKKNMFRLMDENKELKEKNEEWKQVDSLYGDEQDDPCFVKSMIEEIKEENRKLTKENEELHKTAEDAWDRILERLERLDD